MTVTSNLLIEQYLTESGSWEDGVLTFPIANPTPGLEANSYYFSHPLWAKGYLDACHRDEAFRSLWQAALESWDDKIVVDIGCGPGNLLATLGGSPKLIIGVDVAKGSLELARELDYIPILADAHQLPLKSGFADIVTINASLHHCDDMSKVLQEAARLVRPGGKLITDRDQQLSSKDLKGIAHFIWQFRLKLWQLIKRGPHANTEQQKWMIASEVHGEEPGDGVTPDLYYNVLEPMGFEVKLYPHNHNVGAEALQGNYGQSELRWRILQRLSGMNPNSSEAAMSFMCIATKK